MSVIAVFICVYKLLCITDCFVEYSPNREICLPELLFSEVVPTRDPRLSVSSSSSVYFDTAKAFAKGIPPEDWYEATPMESDWNDSAKKLLIHLPVNSLYRPEKADRESELAHVSCVETEIEHEMVEGLVASAVDRHSVVGVEGVVSADLDSDDERISRVIQTCMEPLVVNVKTTSSDEGDEPGHDSPTAKSSTIAAALIKSGISPEMVRRRLQKVEAKLSALRSRKKTSTEVAKPADALENHSVDLSEKQLVDRNIPQNQFSVAISHVSAMEIDGSNASDGHTHNPNVDTTSAILHKVYSEQLSGSSKSSNHVAVLQQKQNVASHPVSLQSPHEKASDFSQADDSGCRMDEPPWYVGHLSLDTKWDSQFIESQAVSRTLVEAMRNWRLRKPLDLIVSGQLRDVALDWTPMKMTWKTDHTVDCCWNSVLWYFNTLLGEPADPLNQQAMLEEDFMADSVEVLPDDDWWGFGGDKVSKPAAAGLVESSHTTLLSLEKQGVPEPGSDVQKSHYFAVEPSVEKSPSVVKSVVLPSDKSYVAPLAETHRKRSSQSDSSHREKLEHSDVQKNLSESSSSRSGDEPGSEKRKRKHDDKKKSKHSKQAANDSDKSVQPVKESRQKDQDTEKENKKEPPDTRKDDRRTADGKEKEKHSRKTKKHKRDAGDAEDEAKEPAAFAENARGADIADLLRVFVGADEKKLALLLKAMHNAKQFNSHKLTTSTSLHYAVALAVLDENLSGKDAVIPASLLSQELQQQYQQHSSDVEQLNSSKSVATESSVKGVFDSVSDFMNAVLSGRSDVSDVKSAAANGLSTSCLDELRFSESDNVPATSSSKVPTVGKATVKVESEVADEKNFFGPKVKPLPTVDDVAVFEEINKVAVDRSAIGKEKIVLPAVDKDQKVVFSKQSGSADAVKAESEHKHQKRKTSDGIGKHKVAETDDGKHVSSKQPKKQSGGVSKALDNLRDEYSQPEDRKDAHRHHRSKKETLSSAERRTADLSVSRKSDTKSKHSSSHSQSSQLERSKHDRHEKKDRSHDHHKKSARGEKQASRERPLTSSFEAISDTELEGQSVDDRSSRMSKRRSRATRNKTSASDKARTNDAHADSTSKMADSVTKMAIRPDRADSDDKTSSVAQTEKLPVSTSQPAVTVSLDVTSTASHVMYRPSNIFKIGSGATTAPMKTATTDMFISSRGPRFMQTFRRSQIAKRRSQRESQQTATGGKLLTAPHKSPSSMILSKPGVRPIGLTFEATLAALSTSTATGQLDSSMSQLQSFTSADSSTAGMTSPMAACSLLVGTAVDSQKSPLKADPVYSSQVVPPPLPLSPKAHEAEDAPPLPEDDPCDSRTTSVAGSPPLDLSMLCGDSLLTSVEKQNISVINSSGSLSDTTAGFASMYPYNGLSTQGSAPEQFISQSDYANYWTMPSYGAYGYESSAYGSAAYSWYYGQALYSMPHPLVMPASSVSTEALDTVPPASDVLASGDGSYGSYQFIPPLAMPPTPDGSFTDMSTPQQEMAWPGYGPYGFDPQFPNSTPLEISPLIRLRAPPRLSSDDEMVPAWMSRSPRLHLPSDQPPSDAISPLMPPGYFARFSSSSGDVSNEGRVVVGPRKKRFFVYSNNTELKAHVTVSN